MGDWIALDGVTVQARLERRSALVRNAGDTTREAMAEEARVVAANVDVVIVVRALDMPVRPGRVQQFVALAYASGADVAFVLTKADCHDDVARAICEIELVAPGISVLAVSAVTGEGMGELVTLIGGRTFVLLGESGAGKSTLVNRLAGEELLATGEVQRSGAGPPHDDRTGSWWCWRVSASRSTRRACAPPVSGARLPTCPRAFADVEELPVGLPLLRLLARLRAGLRRPRRHSAGAPRAPHQHTLREQRALEVRLDPRLASERRKKWRAMERSSPARQLAGSVAQVQNTTARPASMLGPDG